MNCSTSESSIRSCTIQLELSCYNWYHFRNRPEPFTVVLRSLRSTTQKRLGSGCEANKEHTIGLQIEICLSRIAAYGTVALHVELAHPDLLRRKAMYSQPVHFGIVSEAGWLFQAHLISQMLDETQSWNRTTRWTASLKGFRCGTLNCAMLLLHTFFKRKTSRKRNTTAVILN